jgi:hypothetical protein
MKSPTNLRPEIASAEYGYLAKFLFVEEDGQRRHSVQPVAAPIAEAVLTLDLDKVNANLLVGREFSFDNLALVNFVAQAVIKVRHPRELTAAQNRPAVPEETIRAHHISGVAPTQYAIDITNGRPTFSTMEEILQEGLTPYMAGWLKALGDDYTPDGDSIKSLLQQARN